MKSQIIAIVAAVLVVGCGAPDISLHKPALDGNIEAVKQHLAAGADVNAIDKYGETPLDAALEINDLHSSKQKTSKKETAALLRKHGGKTGEELKAEGK